MDEAPMVLVLSGGLSNEREVSLISGAEMAKALSVHFPVEQHILNAHSLPEWIDSDRYVVFPALHGEFGEDGVLQEMLEVRGIHYSGSDSASSALCMDKVASKALVEKAGVRTSRDVHFTSCPSLNELDRIIAEAGPSIVIKPTNQGSSCGVSFVDSRDALSRAVEALHDGPWMFEERIYGREFSVGVLAGKALGVVEIVPRDGSYDYKHKYTPGTTDYIFPAKIDLSLEQEMKRFAEISFRVCACRDFARVDLMATENEAYFLEINTIPGLTPTSLLPKSARCHGMDFTALAQLMVEPAIQRFYSRASSVKAFL